MTRAAARVKRTPRSSYSTGQSFIAFAMLGGVDGNYTTLPTIVLGGGDDGGDSPNPSDGGYTDDDDNEEYPTPFTYRDNKGRLRYIDAAIRKLLRFHQKSVLSFLLVRQSLDVE